LVGTAGSSRRQLLRASVAAGAAAALGGCGGSSHHHKRHGPAADRNVGLLDHALGLERRAIAAYAAGIPLLAGSDKLIATQFLKQELLHAGRLIALIQAMGGRVQARSQSYDLGQPRTPRQIIELLHTVEQAEIAAYLKLFPELSGGALRANVATILANDAQHVAILRRALGELPVPSAFPSAAE
jgi:Ferritin-like domain/TAT (twin-arginine translocation) pathway signal sequence